ncbi:MAG: Ig-like domain-containing protein [Bacteroidales bacterium]|jgi:hypothetical protein
MKKRYLLLLGVIFNSFIILSQEVDTIYVNENGIERVLVERNTVPELEGIPANSIAYRVFVDMEPNYRMLGFGGFEGIRLLTLLPSSENGLYNYTGIGPLRTGDQISATFIGLFPQIAYDSYITDGRLGSLGNIGVLKSVDETGMVLAADHVSAVNPNNIIYGNSTSNDILGSDGSEPMVDIENFGIAVPLGSIGYDSSGVNIIFVGQFTTDGAFVFELNFDLLTEIMGTKVLVSNVSYNSEDYSVNEPPTVEITSPSDGATYDFGTSVNISASASDPDGTVDSLEFFVNEEKIGAILTPPYEISRQFSVAGTYELNVVATDNEGLSVTSDTITITIEEEQQMPPQVSITSHQEGDCVEVNSSLTLLADASDSDGTVASVRFSIDGITLETDTEAPFETEWTPGETGLFGISALVTDNDGLTGVSTVNVNVSEICLDGIEMYEDGVDGLHIYPNPVSEIITVEVFSKQIGRDAAYEIYDIQGNKILQDNFELRNEETTIQIDLSSFAKGFYVVKLSAGNRTYSKYLIKE